MKQVLKELFKDFMTLTSKISIQNTGIKTGAFFNNNEQFQNIILCII